MPTGLPIPIHLAHRLRVMQEMITVNSKWLIDAVCSQGRLSGQEHVRMDGVVEGGEGAHGVRIKMAAALARSYKTNPKRASQSAGESLLPVAIAVEKSTLYGVVFQK